MRICYALLYNDTACTDPERFFERAPLMRHLPQAVADRGHEVDVVIVFSTDHTFVEGGVRYHFVRSGVLPHALCQRPALRALRTIHSLRPGLIHFHGTSLYLNHGLLLAMLRYALRSADRSA